LSEVEIGTIFIMSHIICENDIQLWELIDSMAAAKLPDKAASLWGRLNANFTNKAARKN
jgi:hypothetical protein